MGKFSKFKLVIFIISCVCLGYDDASAIYPAHKENYIDLAEETSCGEIREFRKHSRIIGGEVAEVGEFPFIASVHKGDGMHFCSAFILKERVLVTAAHCFIDTMIGSEAYKKYEIVVGTNNWDDKGNQSNVYKISRVHIHPQYSYLKPNVENDIALVWTDRPFQWSSNVKPICLATTSLPQQELGLIAGWGIRSQEENLKQWMEDTSMRKVNLPIWDNDACQNEYMKHRVNWITKPTHVCAGYQNKALDTCEGDSGAPLILIENERRIAYGIVSVGEGCATQLPGIYTRISAFTTWIQENSR